MPILSELLLIMLVSAVALFLCHKIGVPPLIGYLLTGILVGPSALGLITQVQMVDSLANIGVILLMFSVGLQFSLGELARMGRPVLVGMALQMGLTIAVITAIGATLGFETRESVFYGFLIAASSTAIILKSLQESGQQDSPHGRLSVSISISQDIGMILLVLLIPLFVGSEDFDLVGNVGGLILKSALTLVAVIVTARYITPALLYQIARTRDRELFLFVIVILCFTVAWLVSAIGLSLALGAFLAGLIVSESEYSNQAIGNIIPFKDLFASIFFVSIGMMLDTAAFLRAWPVILLLSAAIIAGKTILAMLAIRLLRYPVRTALLSGIALIPIGEFSFILAVAGLNAGVITQEGYQIFLASSIFSMAATPVLIGWGTGIADFLARFAPITPAPASSSGVPDGHLLIIGYGLNGSNLAHAAGRAGIPYQAIEMNAETVRRESRDGVNIMFGDATQPSVLEGAGIDRARVVVIAISDPAATARITELARRLNPLVTIIVRTRFTSEVAPLHELGADEVVPEEFETSLEIFTRALRRFFLPRHEIDSMVEELRSSSYEALRQKGMVAAPPLRLPDFDLVSISVHENSRAVGQSLSGLELRPRFGVTVVALQRDEHILPNPEPSKPLRTGDSLFVLGRPVDLAALEHFLHGEAKPS